MTNETLVNIINDKAKEECPVDGYKTWAEFFIRSTEFSIGNLEKVFENLSTKEKDFLHDIGFYNSVDYTRSVHEGWGRRVVKLEERDILLSFNCKVSIFDDFFPLIGTDFCQIVTKTKIIKYEYNRVY